MKITCVLKWIWRCISEDWCGRLRPPPPPPPSRPIAARLTLCCFDCRDYLLLRTFINFDQFSAEKGWRVNRDLGRQISFARCFMFCRPRSFVTITNSQPRRNRRRREVITQISSHAVCHTVFISAKLARSENLSKNSVTFKNYPPKKLRTVS